MLQIECVCQDRLGTKIGMVVVGGEEGEAFLVLQELDGLLSEKLAEVSVTLSTLRKTHRYFTMP
eukprot:COSAG06_NODE_35139_length_463_cov_16.950549_1_plen_63_part_10